MKRDLERVEEAITKGFHEAGFIFREGEWDMERAVKLIAPSIDRLITERVVEELEAYEAFRVQQKVYSHVLQEYAKNRIDELKSNLQDA